MKGGYRTIRASTSAAAPMTERSNSLTGCPHPSAFLESDKNPDNLGSSLADDSGYFLFSDAQ
jgi:hypothetical protein